MRHDHVRFQREADAARLPGGRSSLALCVPRPGGPAGAPRRAIRCFAVAAAVCAALSAGPATAQTVDSSPVRLDATQPVPGRIFTAWIDAPTLAGQLYSLAFDPAARAVPLPVPGAGELGLAMSPSLLFLQTAFLDGQGHGAFNLLLPSAPALVGLRFHLQAVAFTPQRPSGAILSNLYQGDFTAADSHTPVARKAMIPRALHTATPLADGRVLILGGGNGTLTAPAGTRVSEVYHPWTKRFDYTRTAAGSVTALTTLRVMHTATRLDDGRVLVAGGVDAAGNVMSAAEVFDAATGQFTPVGNMVQARAAHTAVKLPGGLVLLAGGTVSSFAVPAVFGGATQTTEIFNPATNTFVAGPAMRQKRMLHSALPIKSGGKDYVLMMSGFNGLLLGLLPTYTATAEVFDVGTASFQTSMGAVPVGSLRAARAGFGAVVQMNGRVLVVGGVAGSVPAAIKSVEEFDPATGVFTTVANMTIERAVPGVAALPGGKVLIQGGVLGSLTAPTATATAYLWDGVKLAPAAPLGSTRGAHAAVPLASGTVLALGGADTNSQALDSAEIYTP